MGPPGMSYSAGTTMLMGEHTAWAAATALGSLCQRKTTAEATHAERLSLKQVLPAVLLGSSWPRSHLLGRDGRPLDLNRGADRRVWAAAPRSAQQDRVCARGPSRRPRWSMASIL